MPMARSSSCFGLGASLVGLVCALAAIGAGCQPDAGRSGRPRDTPMEDDDPVVDAARVDSRPTSPDAPSPIDTRIVDAAAGADAPPSGADGPADGAAPDAPSADTGPQLLIQNPVPADAGTPRCTITGIRTVADFERVFFQEAGVAAAQKRRHCADGDCHGGNYGPDLCGTGVGLKLAMVKDTYHCGGLGMKVIDAERPDSSLLLWRLFLPQATVKCSSMDEYEMRRMPVKVGQEDSGGEASSVGNRLSAQELECARWYVHEVAKAVKGAN